MSSSNLIHLISIYFLELLFFFYIRGSRPFARSSLLISLKVKYFSILESFLFVLYISLWLFFLILSVEAFVAALYVDKGLRHVEVFCRVCLFPRLEVRTLSQDCLQISNTRAVLAVLRRKNTWKFKSQFHLSRKNRARTYTPECWSRFRHIACWLLASWKFAGL